MEEKPKVKKRSDINISVDLREGDKDKMKALAKASRMKLSEYARALAEYAIDENLVFKWERRVVKVPREEQGDVGKA